MATRNTQTESTPSLRERMAGFVQHGEVSGLVSLVSRGGRAEVDVLGTKSFDGSEPMQRDTIFRISSMTKAIAAAAAMILLDEGKLRLYAPVDSLLPELANRRVLRRIDGPLDDTEPSNRPITVRDLLTFTFGFGILMGPGRYPIQQAMAEQGIRMGPPEPRKQAPPDEWIAALGRLPLMYQPGERWMYDVGSDVLTVLVARASGQPFDRFLAERIFEPLGMVDTGFSVPPEKLCRFLPSYWSNFQTASLEVFDPVDGQWTQPPAFASASGGLVSTVDDFHAFARMLLQRGVHGEKRILSEQAVNVMTRNQLTADQKAISGLVPGYFRTHGWGFGMGTFCGAPGEAEPDGAYGWDGGLGTTWRSSPKDDTVAILMTQRAWTSPEPPAVSQEFLRAVFGEGSEPEAATSSSAPPG